MGVPPLGVRAEKGSGPWAKADAGEVSVHRELLSLPSQCPGEPAKGSVSRGGGDCDCSSVSEPSPWRSGRRGRRAHTWREPEDPLQLSRKGVVRS